MIATANTQIAVGDTVSGRFVPGLKPISGKVRKVELDHAGVNVYVFVTLRGGLPFHEERKEVVFHVQPNGAAVRSDNPSPQYLAITQR